MQTGHVLHAMHIRSLCSHTAAETQVFAGQCHCFSSSLQLLTPGAAGWSSALPENGSPGRKTDSCAQQEPKGAALWAHNSCTIHEAAACLIAGSSQ